MRLLIKGGRVVDPACGRDEVADLLLQDGLVAEVGKLAKAKADRVIEAEGRVVCPGLIDVHVHLREPGEEHKETVLTGTAAAAAGGFTAVACMPNTRPALDNASIVAEVIRRAAAASCRVYPVGAVTIGREGKGLAELGDMRAAGAVAFSDDGSWIADGNLLRRALEYCRVLGVPVIEHCEDGSLACGGQMNESALSTRLGLPGKPAASEAAAVARDIEIAECAGGRLHVAHVSCARGVELIRSAKERGLAVTCETAPHYLTLTEEAVLGYDTNAKVNPPLRSRHDLEALREAVADGTIDAIATDHAPHATVDKEGEFDVAASGISGLETAVGLILTELVATGVISMARLVELMSTGPARVLGLPGGALSPGDIADVTIIDPKAAWTVEPSSFRSMGRNTPFAGRRLVGRPVCTVVGGEVVWEAECS